MPSKAWDQSPERALKLPARVSTKTRLGAALAAPPCPPSRAISRTSTPSDACRDAVVLRSASPARQNLACASVSCSRPGTSRFQSPGTLLPYTAAEAWAEGRHGVRAEAAIVPRQRVCGATDVVKQFRIFIFLPRYIVRGILFNSKRAVRELPQSLCLTLGVSPREDDGKLQRGSRRWGAGRRAHVAAGQEGVGRCDAAVAVDEKPRERTRMRAVGRAVRSLRFNSAS